MVALRPKMGTAESQNPGVPSTCGYHQMGQGKKAERDECPVKGKEEKRPGRDVDEDDIETGAGH